MATEMKYLEVPASTREIVTLRCDLCGQRSREGTDEWDSDGWYEHSETALSATKTHALPWIGISVRRMCGHMPSLFRS